VSEPLREEVALSTELYQLFTKLGLNGSQVKVYGALLKYGEMIASDIAVKSGVARQDIYRVLSELFEIGIIEKLLGTPLKFRATPLKVSTNLLIDRVEANIIEQRKKADQISRKFDREKSESQLQEFICTSATPPNVVFMDRVKLSMGKLKKSEYIMTTPNRMYKVLESMKNDFGKALNRGGEVRYILEFYKGECSLPKVAISFLDKYPQLFKIKYLPEGHPIVPLAIHDFQEVTIITAGKGVEIRYANSIWSNDPYVVSIIREYFELMWEYIATSGPLISATKAA
jgi:sugar-specific transcriptional regulator TrmB